MPFHPYNFDVHSPSLQELYSSQRGGVIPVFSGATRQRGYGLGGVFTRMFNGFVPVVKNVAKAAGKQLVKTGANFLTDMIDGKNAKNAALDGITSGGKNLMRELVSNVSAGKRGGVKRKRKTSAKTPVKRARKRRTRDIFV